MSNPRPESRIKSLEQRATDIEANIVELSADMAEELKAVRQDIKQLDDSVKDSYVQIGGLFDRNFQSIEAVEGRLNRIESDISGIEVAMATKEDLSKIGTRFDKIEGCIDEQGKKLDQLLQLVQKKLGE